MTDSKELATREKPSLLRRFGERYGVEPNKMLATLQETCFRGAASQEQFVALLVVADQYGLNPFTKEIYAFPDTKTGGVVPVVGVDGWCRIINEHPQFDGVEFREAPDKVQGAGSHACPEWIEAVIYRKDRSHPTVVREYFEETYRPARPNKGPGPWQTHTKRMLRHKALIQGARIAFGFVGIYDEDEAERIIEAQVVSEEVVAQPAGVVNRVHAALGIAQPVVETDENGEVIEAGALVGNMTDEQRETYTEAVDNELAILDGEPTASPVEEATASPPTTTPPESGPKPTARQVESIGKLAASLRWSESETAEVCALYGAETPEGLTKANASRLLRENTPTGTTGTLL